MSVLKPADAITYDLHGARFHSFVAPNRGSAELCAWRTEIAAGSIGVAHTVSREEVILVLDGRPRLSIDGCAVELNPRDVAFVPAGATIRIDNPERQSANLWVSTTPGITATMGGCEPIRPPWTI